MSKKKKKKKNRIPKKQNATPTGLAAAETAKHVEQSQIGKYHARGGHGFSGEDANTFSDKVRLRNVESTGNSNEPHGPDRIVDGVKIQTKYHQTAKGTVDAAFHIDSGLYRYEGQVLEVPLDQYEECVRIMEQKIRNGKVPGISDPIEAKDLVRKGTVTYQQARNIALAGNIESLKFDAKTQAVTSSYMFAISFAVGYARAKWDGKTNKEAAVFALKTAVAAGSATFITGVVTAQVLRTRGAAIGAVAMRSGIKSVYKTSLGKSAIEKIAQASLGKAVYGVAALNHVAKLLRSNVITSTVTTAVTITPDFYRAALARNISWTQFTKNLIVNASGVASGVGGWIVGAAIGTTVGGPVGGVVGGIAGAVVGGTAVSAGAKFVADQIVEDDAKKMMAIVQNVSEQLVFDYMFSETEVKVFADRLKKIINVSWLRNMYGAGNGDDRTTLWAAFAKQELEPISEEIIKQRKRIRLPAARTVQTEIEKLTNNLDFPPV